MKSHPLIAITALVALIGVSPTFADDFMPPSWRGEPKTTVQSWEFSTAANPAVPDFSDNPFGEATATVVYSEPVAPWIDVDEDAPDHQGIWRVEDWIELAIPNNPTFGESKEIWIQLTFHADGAGSPQFFTNPSMGGAVSEVYKQPVTAADIYYHGVYSIFFDHNPDFETIWLMPRDCTIYIDEIVVDTICLPEPTTAALLLLPVIALRRRRS